MLENLKKIYRNKLIENVEEFKDSYYYFYTADGKKIFGIDKAISQNEYLLISQNYIEKKVYDMDKETQPIFEYLFENKSYPFMHKKFKIIVSNCLDADLKIIVKNFYREVKSIIISNVQVFFCSNAYDITLNNSIDLIAYDLGKSIKIHDGIYINETLEGFKLLNYLNIIKNLLNSTDEVYSDITSPLLKMQNQNDAYLYFFSQFVINPLLKESNVKDLILTYFKNDLNVSKTAKDLYINRNSILNKFDQIEKETSLNLQKFSHACAAYIFIISKGI